MDHQGRSILYHYTDFQAVDGILRQAQLRVNNVLRMNDSAEMRHFMDRLCAAVAQRLEEDGDREGAGQVRQRFREELKKEYSAFAACFSFHRDDAAQWERYGNRGRGVCIAFRREYLQKIARGALSLQAVFYRDDMAGHPMVDVFCELARRGGALDGDNPALKAAMREAWACSVSYKHPSFRSEYEMRLVVSPFEKENFGVRPCYHITKERIKDYVHRCTEALRVLGITEGTMAIAGLNPHSGEHGLFGDEEVREVIPAVEELQKEGYNVAGPIGADSVFHQALQGRYNSVLSLYHDQGHIATKTLDFERTISITAGMPILRTSVDHGTALDIAGTGKASAVSLIEAVRLAVKYAPNFMR